MPFSPDIEVKDRETPKMLLTVGVTMDTATLPDVEPELKAYMIEDSYPAGMLVTPETTRFYNNRYFDRDPKNVVLVGECATSELLGMPIARTIAQWELADKVQQWLESLRESWNERWPPSVHEAIDFYVRPIVFEGVVRSSSPRLRRAG